MEKRVIAFAGGKILTMNAEKNHAEVVVVQGEHIVDVGDKNILKSYPEAEIIDLHGKMLLPAFIDPHNHLSLACFAPQWVKLDGLLDKDAIIGAIREHMQAHRGPDSNHVICLNEAIQKYGQAHPEEEWIIGFPWEGMETGGGTLTKSDLDEACPDRPVLLINGSLHKAIVNTEALALSGIDQSFKDMSNGMIIRDDNGELTGELLETAMIPALKLALDINTEEYADIIEARAKELLTYGITSVHDPGVTPAAETAYQYLYSHKRLPVSVLMMPHGRMLFDNQLGSCLDGPVTGTGDEFLRVGPVKLFADGATQMTSSFSGKIAGTVHTFGVPRDDFEDMIIEATKRGFRVCVHSLGNTSTEVLIDTFEKALKHVPDGLEMRPRIDHLFLMSEEQIKRFAAMGGCAAIQPHYVVRSSMLIDVPFEDLKWFAFDIMMKEGMVIASSSDNPCFGSDYAIEPVKGSVIGATMSTDAGKVLVHDDMSYFEQWLWMYTAGAAYVGGLEKERGMLKEGLVADLVILDGELDVNNPPTVYETWKFGEKVYSRDAK